MLCQPSGWQAEKSLPDLQIGEARTFAQTGMYTPTETRVLAREKFNGESNPGESIERPQVPRLYTANINSFFVWFALGRGRR